MISWSDLHTEPPAQAKELDLLVSGVRIPCPPSSAGDELPGDRPVPLVLLGSHPGEMGVLQVADDDCSLGTLTTTFLAARTEFALRQRVRQMEGDLLTIGRRFNHDIRTPLGCIVTAAEDLKESLQAKVLSEPGDIRPILDSAEEILQQTQRICLLCQATAVPGELEPVDMAECFQAAADRLEPYAQQMGSRMVAPQEWPSVQGRADWLVVIWWNLLKNALQHSRAARVEGGWEQEGSETWFFVRDLGVGVPLLIRPQMFQPFNKLHLPNSTRGLGLALVQRLVELQGGFCRYNPIPTGGSTFSFKIPQHRSDSRWIVGPKGSSQSRP